MHDLFSTLLENYYRAVPDVEASAVIDSDGLVIASKINPALDELSVAAVTGLLERIESIITTEFKGKMDTVTIEAENRKFLFIKAHTSLFTTIISGGAETYTVLPYAKIAAKKIAAILKGEDIPLEILKSIDITKIYKFSDIENFDDGTSRMFVFKLVIVGDYSCGKTSLFTYFAEGTFDNKYIPTIGVEILEKHYQIKNFKINYVIWDVAGQEAFKTVRQRYYDGARAGFIVFDLTRPESFKNVVKWLKEVKEFSNTKIPLFLLGNKKDLVDERKVSEEEARVFAEKEGMFYIETSAKTGDNVNNAFGAIAAILVKQSIQS